MKKQPDLFEWADGRPCAEIIDLTPIVIRNMPDVDPKYPESAKVIRPAFGRRRSAA